MSCKNCQHGELNYRGFGTKQVEIRLKKLFPSARVMRFDSDSPRLQSLAVMYQKLRQSKVDIIVGTQMVAKGLDLPNLSLVAVPLADWLLYLPDFSASERFFQLLYQVTGRVGRHQPGKVIVQTYNPAHPIIKAALERKYKSFYNQEIADRKQVNYPPFTYILSLTCRRKKQAETIDASIKFSHTISKKFPELTILGPAPAWHERTQRGFRWHMIIKSTDRSKLLKIAASLPANWQFDIDPVNLLN